MIKNSVSDTFMAYLKQKQYSELLGNQKEEFAGIYSMVYKDLQLPLDVKLFKNPDPFSHVVFDNPVRIPISQEETHTCENLSPASDHFPGNKANLQKNNILEFKDKKEAKSIKNQRNRADSTGKRNPEYFIPQYQDRIIEKALDPYKTAEIYIKKVIDMSGEFAYFPKQDKNSTTIPVNTYCEEINNCNNTLQTNKPGTLSFKTGNTIIETSPLTDKSPVPEMITCKKLHSTNIHNKGKQQEADSSRELTLFITNTVNALQNFQSPSRNFTSSNNVKDPVIHIDGYREKGGRVDAGKNYIVGENGPEILMMKGSPGTVVPGSNLGGTTSFTVVFENVTITSGTGLNTGSIINQVKHALDDLAKTDFRAETGTIAV